MTAQYAKVTGKVSNDTFGCEPKYFRDHIRGKQLEIIYSSSNHYIRVKDENQEEWGLFKGQYALITGLGSPTPQQKAKAAAKKLPQKKTG